MKLLWVCQGIPKLSDGSLLIAYQLAGFLSRRHEVDLVFLKSRDETALPPPFFRYAVAVPFRTRKDKLSRLKNIFSLKPNLVSFYASREMKKEIYRLTKEKRYDIIIAMTMNMAQYAGRLRGVKKIVMPHDAEHLIYGQILNDASGILERAKAWLWYKKICFYERRVYPVFDTCLVVSERDRKALLDISDRIKAEVLPSGVDTGFFRPSGKKAQKDMLIFTGVMNTWSNIDAVTFFVKNIFPIIEKNNPSVRFCIAGKKPSAAVRGLACKNIIITGEVPDIRQYLEDAAIFVAPFRIGTGLKHKILEAMAVGIPVVSTTLGANGIDVKSGENIILADTPDEFARGLIGLLCDDRLREKIVRNAGVLVREKYNWDSIGQVMENILQRVLRS